MSCALIDQALEMKPSSSNPVNELRTGTDSKFLNFRSIRSCAAELAEPVAFEFIGSATRLPDFLDDCREARRRLITAWRQEEI